jgi:hypothetical protein
MDPETIRKIAAELATQLPSNAWWLLAVQTMLFVGAAALGSFIGEYLKERGKHLATKADFESLKDQLKANTELVETIKADVSHKDWAQREWSNLRRLKVEALITGMHDCETYLDEMRRTANQGELVGKRAPDSEMGTIAALYLPELETQVSNFLQTFYQLTVQTSTFGQETLMANDLSGRQKAFEKFQLEYMPKYAEFRNASDALTAAARDLLFEIMGANPTYAIGPTQN